MSRILASSICFGLDAIVVYKRITLGHGIPRIAGVCAIGGLHANVPFGCRVSVRVLTQTRILQARSVDASALLHAELSHGLAMSAAIIIALAVAALLTTLGVAALLIALLSRQMTNRRLHGTGPGVLTSDAADFDRFRMFGDRAYRPREHGGTIDDPLGISAFVDIIGKQILGAEETSFAIALDAQWGMGKTSAMLLLRQWLDEKGCLTVWFNAWKYRGSDIQRAFLSAVISAIPIPILDRFLFSRRGRVKAIKEAGDLIGRATRLGQVGTLIANALQDDARYRSQLEDDFAEVIKYWSSDEGHRRPLVVVFVDDLDRCNPNEIAQILETMKLFFDTPGSIFVFGYDVQLVTTSIEEDYKRIINDGSTYLKKIIQFTYQLPQPDTAALRRFVDASITERRLQPFFRKLEEDTGFDYRELVIKGTVRNLRDIKRFLDAVVVSAQVVSRQLTDGRAYMALCLLVMLQIRWPACYRELDRKTRDDRLREFVGDISWYLNLIAQEAASVEAGTESGTIQEDVAANRRKSDIERRMPWLAASEDLQGFLRTYSLVGMEDVIERLITNGLPSVVPVPEEDEETPSQLAERPVDDRLLLANPLRFIGRSEDLTWLLGQLEEAGTGGVVTLEGKGGIGKTALAAVAVHQVAEKGRFRDGIVVVHCENKTRIADVLRDVLSRLVPLRNVPETSSEADLAEIAFRVLSGKNILIVLDNIEPELAIEQVVAPLRAAGATLLLIARHALPLGQESRRELGLLSAEEALELFAQSLGRSSVQTLGPGERAAAERIVAVLGQHTLAVKLAGAYAASAKRPLDALALELEQDPLRVPQDGIASATELVFNRSIEQLPASAKRLFAALAGFANLQFGRTATLALARDPAVAGSATDIDLLIRRALVDSSYDPAMPEASDRERLELHPLLRALAASMLAVWPVEQREAVLRTLATYYADYCQRAPEIALDTDEANIVGALEWALQHSMDDVVATICLGMRDYWNNRWRTEASLRYLPQGIKAAERVALRSGQRDDRLHAADIALAYAQTLRRTGNLGKASETLESNLAMRRAVQDRQGEGRVLSQLGLIARLRGQMADAERYFMQSLPIRREVQDRIGEGYDLSQLGQMAKTRGQLAEAERYFSESLAIRRSIGDRAGEAGDLGYLGQIARLRGRLEVAEGYFQQSLAIAREIRYLRAEATALSQLGQLERARGDLHSAERYLIEALELRRQAQDARGQGFDLGLLGRVAQARGDLSKAEEYFRQSLATARNVEDRRGEAAVLSSLGQLGLARGQLEEAEHFLTQSLELRRAVQDRQGEGIDLSQFGRLYLDRGELDKAEQSFRESLAVDREIQDRPGEGVDLSQLGLVAIERSRLDEAQLLLDQSLAIRREVHDPRGEGVDLALLGRIALGRNKLAEAENYYQQSLSIARRVHNRRGEGVNLCQLGIIAGRQGDFARAEELIRDSFDIAREVDNGLDIADAQSALGQLLIEYRSQHDEGCSLLREAIHRYHQIGSPSEQKNREMTRRWGCGE